MKVVFTESEHFTHVELIPEDLKEAAELLRYANNTKKEPASISTSFSIYQTDAPVTCSIVTGKLKPTKQVNSVRR